jgi:hypothetical protein
VDELELGATVVVELVAGADSPDPQAESRSKTTTDANADGLTNLPPVDLPGEPEPPAGSMSFPRP